MCSMIIYMCNSINYIYHEYQRDQLVKLLQKSFLISFIPKFLVQDS
jgi:hypothetical protein